MPEYRGFIYEELPEDKIKVVETTEAALTVWRDSHPYHNKDYQPDFDSPGKTFGNLVIAKSYIDTDLQDSREKTVKYRWSHITADMIKKIDGLQLTGRLIATAHYEENTHVSGYTWTTDIQAYQIGVYGGGFILIQSGAIIHAFSHFNGDYELVWYLNNYGGKACQRNITWL